MPRLVITEAAREGLDRCRRFLSERDPEAGQRAARSIARQFQRLECAPMIGRPISSDGELRELVIGFGKAGYVTLYRYVADADAVYILAFRHQREAGY